MTNPFTFTHNAMEVGVGQCNTDIADQNLEYLKAATDNLQASVDALPAQLDPDIIPLGNKSTNFTLTANSEHEANITDSCEMLKPSIESSSKRTYCYIEFTLASGKSLTINGVKWDNDYVPTLRTDRVNCIMLRYKTSEGFWRGSYKWGGN